MAPVNTTTIIYLILFSNIMFAVSSNIYQLVARDQAPSMVQPFKSGNTLDDKMCLSMCVHNRECVSYAFIHGQTTRTNCLLYGVLFRPYPGQSMALKNHPGAHLFSPVARDCADLFQFGIRKNGVYDVDIVGKYRRKVYCNMKEDGGGWMVFQKRFDGSVEFFTRAWKECKEGFGNVEGEHWLGNKWLHLMTTSEKYDYLVLAKDFQGVIQKSKLVCVRIEDEAQNYGITYQSVINYNHNNPYERRVTGTAMSYNGSQFGTYDRDTSKNCDSKYGPWWHKTCHVNAMNGIYPAREQISSEANGLIWHSWKGYLKSLKESLLMVRPQKFVADEHF
uniref:Fibrinogen C-terminal domain-containing protein n=1 Tax=Clytia hemisphaerica TaxID=252671 RepID=A0A7M5XDA9_9CNID